MENNTDNNTAMSSAREKLADITEIMDRLENGEEYAEEEAHELPLSISFRSGWRSVGVEPEEFNPEEFRIELTTGGPAVQIIGAVVCGELLYPVLQARDWRTGWQELSLTEEEDEALQRFVGLFSPIC